jgi:hypothetical protein
LFCLFRPILKTGFSQPRVVIKFPPSASLFYNGGHSGSLGLLLIFADSNNIGSPDFVWLNRDPRALVDHVKSGFVSHGPLSMRPLFYFFIRLEKKAEFTTID